MKPCRWRSFVHGEEYPSCKAGMCVEDELCPGDCETRRAFEALEEVAEHYANGGHWRRTNHPNGDVVFTADMVWAEKAVKALNRVGR